MYSNFAAAVLQHIVVSVLGLRLGFMCFVFHMHVLHILFCFAMCEAFLLAGGYHVLTFAGQCSGWASAS